MPGAPDRAVEVLSPRDRSLDRTEKARASLALGTRLVWISNSQARTAFTYRRTGTPAAIGPDDLLTAKEILLGCAIGVAATFPRTHPRP